jgi:WD40 repeat protein
VKLSRFAALGFIAALVACNPTLPPPPPGWNLELRAGTTNIDSSFFQSTKPDATRSSDDQARFAQLREAIIKKVPSLNLGSALASGFVPNSKATKSNTRETAGLALSVFMAVTKDGAAPASELSFIYSGPKGTYDKPITYPAGYAWLASPLVIPKGSGSYTFSSTLQDGTLAGSVNVNFEDQTQWLPLPLPANNPSGFGASSGQYDNVFVAKWQAVPEAQSYLGLILDRTDQNNQKYVGSFLTKNTQIETQEFNGIQDHSYSLDLIATNIDLTQDATKPYGAIPATMKSSISSFFLNSFGGTPGLTLDQTRINLLAKPNQTGEGVLKITDGGYAPLGYKAIISGTGLELTGTTTGVLVGGESRELRIKGTCTGADLTGLVTFTSNDPNNKTKAVPVTLECDVPVTATLELAKLSHNANVQFIQYSPDGTKVATSDGTDIIIWDAFTTKAIRKIAPAVNSYSGTVFSLAWHPDSNLLAVGGQNTVTVFNTSIGLSVVSASPSGTIQSIDWNADGSQFVIGLNAAVQIYDGSSGGLVRRIELLGSTSIYYPATVAWSKSSGKLATVLGDRVTTWDTTTGTELNHYVGTSALYYSPTTASWNSSGDTLAFLTTDGSIGIWVVEKSNLERSIPVQSSPGFSSTPGTSNVKWSRTGSNVALTIENVTNSIPTTSIGVWNALTGNIQIQFPVINIFMGYSSLKTLDWSSDGQFLLTQAGTSAISWNANTGARAGQYGFVSGTIAALHFNTNGTQLLVGANSSYDSKSTLNLMDTPGGNVLQNFTTPQQITMVDWRKDMNQVIGVSSSGGIVQSYSPGTWNLLNTFEGYAPSAYSPDGTRIAVSLNDTRVRILDASTGTVLQTIGIAVPLGCLGCGGSGATLQNLTWSPDSSKIVLVGTYTASKLQVYDVASGQLLWAKDIAYNYFATYSVIWSPDGKRIANGSQFFDAITGDLVEVFNLAAPDGVPVALAWSPDSRYVLTLKSNSLELRNANSGRKILSLFELPSGSFGMMSQKVAVNWNAQSNRFAITDGQSSVYIYKFSQP